MWYYINQVYRGLGGEFTNLVGYSRFVELMPGVIIPQFIQENNQKISIVTALNP